MPLTGRRMVPSLRPLSFSKKLIKLKQYLLYRAIQDSLGVWGQVN